MTDTTNEANPAPPGRRYRPRGSVVRDRRLTPRFTVAEMVEIQAAADAVRLTATGFCAFAALVVARRRAGGPGDVAVASMEEVAELQRELFAARITLNRSGVNLNQAVAAFNSTGVAPVWLEYAAGRVLRAVAGLDAVVSRIDRRLRRAGGRS